MTKNKITYGSSLAALQYAAENDTKIILDSPAFPHVFTDEETRRGWASLFFDLMLKGKTIGGDRVRSTKVTDEEILVVCEGNVVNRLEYEELYIFSDKNIIGLPEAKEENKKCYVVDYIKPKSLVTPHMFYIKTEEDFVNEIFIKKDNAKAPVNIYVVSHLEKEQLHSFDFSDTMVKFAVEDLMTKNGFKGISNGRRHTNVALEVEHREVIENMNYYEDTENIKFFNGN
mgnify:CR=1 FL=1